MSKQTNTNRRDTSAISRAFLIRCWQQEGEWRFMLEDVATRERHVFIQLTDMLTYLLVELPPAAAENKRDD